MILPGRLAWLATAAAWLALAAAAWPAAASAAEEGEAPAWRLFEVTAPEPPVGVEAAPGPVPLGKVGDIEFQAPNRGALITAGNPPTIKPGVWEYDGESWHELSTVCGATDGRIAWAGPEEFWTISDGRPGQALVEGKRPPLIDDTLCRFSNPNHAGEPLRVMQSFAFPAFQVDSYQPMHAAGCLSASDCWFAGDPLPEQSTEDGAFHLHWNGASLVEQPYPIEGHAVQDMVAFHERLYESVLLAPGDRVERALPEPPVVHAIDPAGVEPTFQGLVELPLYGGEELPSELGFAHLAAGEEFLWLAAGPQREREPPGPAQLSVLRGSNLSGRQGSWTPLLGPGSSLEGGFPNQTATALAVEPVSGDAWLGLDTIEDVQHPKGSAHAHLLRLAAEGEQPIEEEVTLPSAAEAGAGPGGAAARLACPAVHDCWLATTQGFLYHYSTEAEEKIERDPSAAFDTLIAERPADEGLPQTPSDILPIDTSGEEAPPPTAATTTSKPQKLLKTVPLMSHLRSRVVRGTVLQLRFHLAVKARIRLVAKRRRAVVAATAMRTFKAGERTLELRLDVHRWPTKLQLQTHALAKLPTVPVGSGEESVVTTSLAFPYTRAARAFGPLP